MELATLIGFVVGVIGFLLITLTIKRISQSYRVWLLVGVIGVSLLPQPFLSDQIRPMYAIGWMLAIALMVAGGLLVRQLKKS